MSIRASFETIAPAVLSFHRSMARQAVAMREMLAGLEAMDEKEFIAAIAEDASASPSLVQLMRTTAEEIFCAPNGTVALAESCARVAEMVHRRSKEIVERRRALGLE